MTEIVEIQGIKNDKVDVVCPKCGYAQKTKYDPTKLKYGCTHCQCRVPNPYYKNRIELQCKKCKNIQVENYEIEKKFYFCNNCKERIVNPFSIRDAKIREKSDLIELATDFILDQLFDIQDIKNVKLAIKLLQENINAILQRCMPEDPTENQHYVSNALEISRLIEEQTKLLEKKAVISDYEDMRNFFNVFDFFQEEKEIEANNALRKAQLDQMFKR